MKQKVVGILGGMGPESTADLFLKIIRSTPIAREDDHLRVIVDNNPKIPNRTDAILSGDTEPAIAGLCETARNLEGAGAELIGIPCNTAHAFLTEVRDSVSVPVLDMIDETAQHAKEALGPGNSFGILATDGTLRTRLYHDALDRHGLSAAVPGADAQNALMQTIGEVKLAGVCGSSVRLVALAIDDLTRQGVRALIAGCTEVSLVLDEHTPDLTWLDPLQVLAEALVREATA